MPFTGSARVTTNECAASQGHGHRRVASVKSWPAPLPPAERCCLSAHFSLFSMASERRSKERRHAIDGSLDSAMSGLPLPSAQPESVRDSGGLSANYGSDTALVNSVPAGLLRLLIDRLTCSSTAYGDSANGSSGRTRYNREVVRARDRGQR
jgi:hypothetical protein